MSQENRNTQTALWVRVTNRGFSTSKYPGVATLCMGATAKKLEKEFDGDLCYLVLLKISCVLWVRNFWECLVLRLMRCIWGCGGLHARDW